jgi:hypothetical protein
MRSAPAADSGCLLFAITKFFGDSDEGISFAADSFLRPFSELSASPITPDVRVRKIWNLFVSG